MKQTNSTPVTDGSDAVKRVRETYELFSKYVSRELKEIGMRASYRHVMTPLMENESLTQLQLVNMTGLKAPTISITLRNMEREGIVRREKNDEDRRETHVYITDKGREMYAKIMETLDKAEKLMLDGLTDREIKSLRATLGKMSDSLSSELGEPKGD